MEYIVEKLIDGDWYYEGQGSVEYVNRITAYLASNNITFRVVEVKNENS